MLYSKEESTDPLVLCLFLPPSSEPLGDPILLVDERRESIAGVTGRSGTAAHPPLSVASGGSKRYCVGYLCYIDRAKRRDAFRRERGTQTNGPVFEKKKKTNKTNKNAAVKTYCPRGTPEELCTRVHACAGVGCEFAKKYCCPLYRKHAAVRAEIMKPRAPTPKKNEFGPDIYNKTMDTPAL